MKATERCVRVALVQQAGLKEDPAANLRDLLDLIDEAASGGIDLLLATELALTTYFGGIREALFGGLAEQIPGHATNAVAARARLHQTTIVLPIFASSDGRGLDVAVVIGPDGEIVPGRTRDGRMVPYFTKVHLPKMETNDLVLDEPFHFTAGDTFPVFDTPAGKLGVLICYDRRFPEAWRELALGGAEIVLVPACVPAWEPAAEASTAEMFVAELRTRACENLLFVAACNRAGAERLRGRETRFVGRSCLIAPGGRTLALAPAVEGVIVRGTFALAEIEMARQRLPIFRDRRIDLYGPAAAEGDRR